MPLYIQFCLDFRNHPKTKKLQRLLGVRLRDVAGMMGLLWSWTADYAPDGDLSGYDADDIAEVMDWPTKDSKKLIDALCNCGHNGGSGFLDRDPLRIHNWAYRRGDFIRKRAERRTKAGQEPPKDGQGSDEKPLSKGKGSEVKSSEGQESVDHQRNFLTDDVWTKWRTGYQELWEVGYKEVKFDQEELVLSCNQWGAGEVVTMIENYWQSCRNAKGQQFAPGFFKVRCNLKDVFKKPNLLATVWIPSPQGKPGLPPMNLNAEIVV